MQFLISTTSFLPKKADIIPQKKICLVKFYTLLMAQEMMRAGRHILTWLGFATAIITTAYAAC